MLKAPLRKKFATLWFNDWSFKKKKKEEETKALLGCALFFSTQGSKIMS